MNNDDLPTMEQPSWDRLMKGLLAAEGNVQTPLEAALSLARLIALQKAKAATPPPKDEDIAGIIKTIEGDPEVQAAADVLFAEWRERDSERIREAQERPVMREMPVERQSGIGPAEAATRLFDLMRRLMVQVTQATGNPHNEGWHRDLDALEAEIKQVAAGED